MRPTDNEQGGHYCMRLKTGRLLIRKNATPLPIPSNVTNHLHTIAHRAPFGPTSADRNNVAFPDISNDEKVVDVYDSDSNNSDNENDPYEAADPEVADPEESVEITGVDYQESEHVGVVTK